MSARELIAQVIVVAGGEITGRVRLQKIMYLLCKRGVEADLKFSYHHYGPFSRVVDEGINSAKSAHGLREITKRRSIDGVPFSVFQLDAKKFDDELASIGGMSAGEAKHLVREMISVPSTVIEVAATIIWLCNDENVSDWHSELVKRKGPKARSGRIDDAMTLLGSIGLQGMVRKN